jgi:hypothetical protein
MTNPPNEFAQQLEALFSELQNVLDNLAKKVSEDTDKKLKGHIQNIEKRFRDTAQRMDELEKKTQILEEKFTLMQQTLQPSAVRPSPPVPPQVVMLQPPAVSQAAAPSNPNNHNVVEGEIVAGRKSKKSTNIDRDQAPVTENNYTRLITDSQYYKESIKQSEVIIRNAIELLNSEHAGVHAIETCILIDIRNMAFFENLDFKWYDKFLKEPNIKTVKDLKQLFLSYGLPENLLSFENVQRAIENLVELPEDKLQQRIKDVGSSSFNKALKDFKGLMTQTINNRNGKQTTPDSGAKLTASN